MSTKGEPYLSIIIPAYNEVQRLEASITALRAFLQSAPWTHEVIVVVELSTDDTLPLARRLTEGLEAFHVIGHQVHRGKGHAVRAGMLRARGEIALFMDADLSTPLAEIERFLARFDRPPRVDVLAGNRRHSDSAILKHQGFLRRRMGRTFNWLLRAVAGVRIADTQCGFKAFRREAREAIFAVQKLDGFAFDVEVLLLAEKLGFKVEDLPVEWRNAEGSKVNVVRDSLRMLKDALRVRRLVAAATAEKLA
jgi:dolichyl-phosphate beta-glucosyltransferase